MTRLGFLLLLPGLAVFSRTLCAQESLALELAKAAEAGDVSRVHNLLEDGADPNLPRSFSALESACAGAFPDVVAEMLKKHPDVNARDSAGRTPLIVVAKRAIGANVDQLGAPRENAAEVAKLLVDAAANVNAQDSIFGNAALHDVPDADTARVLIRAGADINLANLDGRTPLMVTLDEDVTRALLEAGADTKLRDHSGKTALDLAHELELTEKIALLEKYPQ